MQNGGIISYRSKTLFQHIIDDLLYAGTNLQIHEFAVEHIRVGTVAKKHVNDVVGRIGPSTSAGEAGVSIGRSGCAGSTRTVLVVLLVGAIEAQATAAQGGGLSGEKLAGRFTDIAFAVPLAIVEQHLVEASYLLGGGEEAGAARYAAMKGSYLIVYIAMYHLLAEEAVVGCWCNLGLVETLHGLEAGAL